MIIVMQYKANLSVGPHDINLKFMIFFNAEESLKDLGKPSGLVNEKCWTWQFCL